MYKERICLADISNYQLGVIWGIGSYIEAEHSLVFRHKNRYFLEQLSNVFDNKIYVHQVKGIEQYVLKSYIADYKSLELLGYTNRNSDYRKLPILDDYKDFLRAYIELHGCVDYCISHKRNKSKYLRLRLRIYGNIGIINDINNIMHNEFGIGHKSIQYMPNKKTAYVVYTALAEIEEIFKIIFGEPYDILFWNETQEKLDCPRKEYRK